VFHGNSRSLADRPGTGPQPTRWRQRLTSPPSRSRQGSITGVESFHIATSGRAETARPALELLGVASDTPMITRDMVAHAKPGPDLFLAAVRDLPAGG
jgi:hypothetical protein